MKSVVIVGTGFGGICAAIELLKRNITDFVMLERRDFAGGTWLQNTYPGAAVDVQSPLYSLSGHPYPWSHLFAKQNELADYTTKLIAQYELQNHIQLNASVNQAKWQGDHWQLSLVDGEVINSKAVINATGPLSTPVIPEFEGLDKFTGHYFHCNDWDHSIDLDNKTVAVIGSGASAVQIIPAIVDKVRSLHVFQRTPHWILPRNDWAIPKALRKLLALKPIYFVIRSFIYWLLELRVIAFKYSRFLLNAVGARPARIHMSRQIKDDNLREKLTPNFTIGCKRILVSNTYYPALQKSNCYLHTKNDGIVKFSEQGIHTSQGDVIKADVVAFATGYNAIESMVSYDVIGKNNCVLNKQWSEYPRAYLGTSLPNFPNYFTVTGPNTGIGHTSAIFVIESQMKYIMSCIDKLTNDAVKSIEPSEHAEHQYTEMIHHEMDKTVWATGGCSSWYQNSAGKVIAMYPGFSFIYRRMCKQFKANDHIVEKK